MKPNEQTRNEILLSIYNEIAGIRGKEDMLFLIRDSLKKYFDFNDSCIMRYNKATRSCWSYIFHAEEARAADPAFEKQRSIEYLVEDGVILENTYPVLWDVPSLLSRGSKQVVFIHETGIREFVTLKLLEGNELLGLLVLLSEKQHSFTTEDLDLLKEIAYPVSIATANIIANEEIVKREEEKNLLLSLSNEIAALKNREDLFHIVNKKIKKLFSVRQFGISKVDDDGQTFSAFLMDIGEEIRSHADYDMTIATRFSVNDPFFVTVMNADGPVIFEVDELIRQPDLPPYVYFWKNAGIKRVIIVALRVGGVGIGTAIFILEEGSEIDTKGVLLKGVCSQLAVAVSNILANEKLQRREEEKTILLSLSNEIAALKSREDLFKVVNGKIKQLLGIKELGFSKIDESGETYSIFLVDVQDKVRKHPDFDSILTAQFDVHDPLFTAVMHLDEPVQYEVDELMKLPGMPAYVSFWSKVGIERVATFPLRVGGNVIGTALFILEKDAEFNSGSRLIRGVCSQLAVTISNILSEERLREKEAEKSMLLEFSNAIASVKDKYNFAKVLKQQLIRLFPIEDYVINILSENEQTVIGFLYDVDSDLFQKQEFLKLLENPIDVNDGVFNRILDSEDPVTFEIEDWAKMEKPPVYLEAARAAGVVYMTGVRMRMEDRNIAFFTFKHDEIGLPPSRLHFLKSICSQIAIAVSNILANEKISRQLVEIEKYRQQLEEEKIYLKEEIENTQNYSEIIGESPEIKAVFRMVTQVAHTDSTVLLLGETGTGKELVARAIHNASPRKNKLMIKVNCAALPANLIESELFGHEKGSFTGAMERRVGKFELANHGTLFLDEIGEMPLELQVKLLRALQEKEIERVGGKATIKTDVRIIAATNRDLEKLMEEGKFRSDLYYRLNIFPIHLPPLRDRREDIPKLALHFIRRYSKKTGKNIQTLTNKALQLLVSYDWPGNIRELEHLIERSVLLAVGNSLVDIHLPVQKNRSVQQSEPGGFKIRTIFENEKEYILKVLKHVDGRVSGEGGAAELLGIPPSTLNSRMKKLGIRRQHRAE